MATWLEDLKFGEEYEREVIKKLKPDTYLKMEDNFPFWDFITVKDNVISLIEVKADRWANQTKRLAIECVSSGKPSGIFISKAHFWIVCVVRKEGTEYYKIPASVLKDLIHRQEYTDIKAVAEDGKNICFMFPLDAFSQYKL